jgi:pyruvate formate lyase activating enzyme
MNDVSDSSVRGIIFDIQRGSFHDGPGIRTTVFFKGCLLRCGWCHNPESWSFGIERIVDAGKERIYGSEVSAGEVLAIVARDRDFFRKSDGGLTLSGGEPSQQFEFCLAMLRLAHAQGIHTCLDTCGSNRIEAFVALLPHVDLFLWDYKIANAQLHRDLTGVDSGEILRIWTSFTPRAPGSCCAARSCRGSTTRPSILGLWPNCPAGIRI